MTITTSTGLQLIDPTISTSPEAVTRAPRLRSLNGARLGLLANHKTHGDTLLEMVLELLQQRYPLGEAVRMTKRHPSEPPTSEQIETLAASTDAMLSAIGDCGSCSSCTVVDGITFESRHIPTAVLITEPFTPTASAIADLNGASWYQPVSVRHPITSLTDDQLRQQADIAARQVEHILLGGTNDETSSLPNGTATLDVDAVNQALEPYRAGLRTDGADLYATHISQRDITLSLVLDTKTCGDCIMPADTIERVTAATLSDQFGPEITVRVQDPRQKAS